MPEIAVVDESVKHSSWGACIFRCFFFHDRFRCDETDDGCLSSPAQQRKANRAPGFQGLKTLLKIHWHFQRFQTATSAFSAIWSRRSIVCWKLLGLYEEPVGPVSSGRYRREKTRSRQTPRQHDAWFHSKVSLPPRSMNQSLLWEQRRRGMDYWSSTRASGRGYRTFFILGNCKMARTCTGKLTLWLCIYTRTSHTCVMRGWNEG